MSGWKGYANADGHWTTPDDARYADCQCTDTWLCSQEAPCLCCCKVLLNRVRDAFEQLMKDRSPYSDDRHRHGLDYIDGWNDALEAVECALDGTR